MQDSATNIKVNISKTKSTDTVFFLGRLETYTKEIIMKILEQVLEKCTGKTGVIIKVNGLKVSKMVKVYFLSYLGLLYIPSEGTKKGLFKDNLLV